jgi:hypothetical protein
MKQNRQVVVLLVLVVVLAIGGPSWLARKQAAALDVKTKATDAQVKALKAKIDQAKSVKKNKANYTAALDKVRAAMPADNDVKGAIRSLQTLAEASGLEWIGYGSSNIVDASVTAAPVKTATPTKEEEAAAARAAKASPKTTVPSAAKADAKFAVGGFDLSITVKGSRTDVLNYLEKIRMLPSPSRLFVVNSVTLDLKKGNGPGDIAGERLTESQINVRAIAFGSSSPATDASTPGAGASPVTTVSAGVTPKTAVPPTVAPTTVAPAAAAVKSATTATSVPVAETSSTTASSA